MQVKIPAGFYPAFVTGPEYLDAIDLIKKVESIS
jgi:hypothetical protein